MDKKSTDTHRFNRLPQEICLFLILTPRLWSFLSKSNLHSNVRSPRLLHVCFSEAVIHKEVTNVRPLITECQGLKIALLRYRFMTKIHETESGHVSLYHSGIRSLSPTISWMSLLERFCFLPNSVVSFCQFSLKQFEYNWKVNGNQSNSVNFKIPPG